MPQPEVISESYQPKNRDRYEVAANLLRAFYDPNNPAKDKWVPKTKTALMYKAYLSSEQFDNYIAILTRHDLVHKGDDKKFEITKAGKEFLVNFGKLPNLRDATEGGP